MSEKEIWKDIEDYKGLYQISNLGRVRSLERVDANGHTVNEKVLASFPNINGYLKVNLYRDRKMEVKSVHRLVADTFIPNPDNLPQVNHKDEDKGNNRVENLEWCTASYNTNYGTRNERAAKANEQAIYVITDSGHRYYFDSARKAAEILGLKACSVSDCLHGRQKTHRSFKFMLAV